MSESAKSNITIKNLTVKLHDIIFCSDEYASSRRRRLIPLAFTPQLPGDGNIANVIPDTGNPGYGKICVEITLPDPQPLYVRALAFWVDIWTEPDPISDPPLLAKPGTYDATDGHWKWYSPNQVPNAKHDATGTVLNKLAVWIKRSGDAWRYDGCSNFKGKTGTNSSCGSGSGSGGALILTFPLMESLGTESLLITIPGGPGKGKYTAKPVGALLWEAECGKQRLLVSVGSCGKVLYIITPDDKVMSQPFESDPFSAAFPGKAFDSNQDVTVTVAQ